MSARAWALPVLVLAASLAMAQPPPVFRAEIGVVVLQATVRNPRGQPVTDLERTAFTVYENGRPQPITIFRAGEAPLSLGILVDNSRSMRERRKAAETAALAALGAARPQDETFLMSFADKARIDVALTSDLRALEAGVRRRDSIGGTALRDAIAQAVDHLQQQARRSRRAILVVSDGRDNASLISLDRLQERAAAAEVAVYAIRVQSEDDAARGGRGRDALLELAEASGGLVHDASGEPQADALGRQVAREMRHSYTIGYAPLSQALDGTYRKLRVVAKGHERLRVQARAGYRASPAQVQRSTGKQWR